MDLSYLMTSEIEYKSLKDKDCLNELELTKMVRYPFVSLKEYYGYIPRKAIRVVERIELRNISYFLNAIQIVLGQCGQSKLEQFNNSLHKEPLRTAINLSMQQNNFIDKKIVFVESACKILLTSNPIRKNGLFDPINVQLDGKLPKFTSYQNEELGNKWFNLFIESKLSILKAAYRSNYAGNEFSLILKSIAYSLYKFSSLAYPIYPNESEADTITTILKTFIIHHTQY